LEVLLLGERKTAEIIAEPAWDGANARLKG
jgi:hypothetical protein